MIKIFVTYVSLFLIIPAIAQQNPESNSEKFANQTGVLISKEYIEMGFLDMIDIRAVKMKNFFTEESIVGLRLEYSPGNEILSSPKIAYIDKDEIDGMIKGIKILQSSVINKSYKSQADFTIQCRSGLILGYFYDSAKDTWQPFVQINKNDPHSTVRLRKDDFPYFLKILFDTQTMK